MMKSRIPRVAAGYLTLFIHAARLEQWLHKPTFDDCIEEELVEGLNSILDNKKLHTIL
jgi:hypothetical protein